MGEPSAPPPSLLSKALIISKIDIIQFQTNELKSQIERQLKIEGIKPGKIKDVLMDLEGMVLDCKFVKDTLEDEVDDDLY